VPMPGTQGARSDANYASFAPHRSVSTYISPDLFI
jgi:hypothetical protein